MNQLASDISTQVKIIESRRIDDYPLVLTVEHVSKILGVSKRKAYEMMEGQNFPLIRIGRCKRVTREAFFGWLHHVASESN